MIKYALWNSTGYMFEDEDSVGNLNYSPEIDEFTVLFDDKETALLNAGAKDVVVPINTDTMKEDLYIVRHNRYSGHFMYWDTPVTIEKEMPGYRFLVRSTYGNRQHTDVVHKDELEKVKQEVV